MIEAVAWCCGESLGYRGAGGQSWQEATPDLSEPAHCPALRGWVIPNYARMPSHTRMCLFAASLALQAAAWPARGAREIGLVAAGYAGCLAADRQYFQDYLDHGRTLGRANLFVYTLPTSALGELAIALKLIGPNQHIHDDVQPVTGLVRHAHRLIEQGEVDGVLALWSDLDAAVCLAIGSGAGGVELAAAKMEMDPRSLARYLAART